MNEQQLVHAQHEGLKPHTILRPLHCARCGYRLWGLAYVGHCPECGLAYDACPGSEKGIYRAERLAFPSWGWTTLALLTTLSLCMFSYLLFEFSAVALVLGILFGAGGILALSIARQQTGDYFRARRSAARVRAHQH